jgi:hypothetical protein
MTDLEAPEESAQPLLQREERPLGWGGAVLGGLAVLAVAVTLSISNYLITPSVFIQSKFVVKDLHRFQDAFGRWPRDLVEFKKVAPGFQHEGRYGYRHNRTMFLLYYPATDAERFYRSDSGKWNSVESRQQEFLALEDDLWTAD